jgi:peptidoglycan/LPS O-acetylase OafA/YrhL
LADGDAPLWNALLRCSLSIAVASLSFFAVERPMRRWIAGPTYASAIR